MGARFLSYGRHSIDDSDIEAVVEILRSDFLTQGPAVDRFEATVAARTGARFAVAVSSGTAALHLACLAAGMGRGHFGVTSAITFVASANCIHYCGGEAAVVDVDSTTLGMCVTALANILARRPEAKVVIPVHYAGLAADMAALRAVAGNRVIIEDASHAFGGYYDDGGPVGCCAHSDMTVFSFHPVKPVTTGEGGVITTNQPELARLLRQLRSHGLEREADRMLDHEQAVEESGDTRSWYYEQQMLGYNYRMTDLAAGLGMNQLTKLDNFLARRRAIAARYDRVFSTLTHLRLHHADPAMRARSGMHLYVLSFDFAALGMGRQAVMDSLRADGVGTQVHYIPVYRQPFHRAQMNVSVADFPAAERFYNGCLSLPLFPDMTDADVDRVIAAVSKLVER